MVQETSEEENEPNETNASATNSAEHERLMAEHNARWKRILLLIVAITVHNIPEGTCKTSCSYLLFRRIVWYMSSPLNSALLSKNQLLIQFCLTNLGLAVGVAFGSIGKASSATFDKARNLAIGIGIQNFPEGLAVSLPLKTAGFSAVKSIWYVKA